MEVVEIGPVADGVLRQRQMFQYHVRAGQPTWTVVSRVSAHRETLESDVEPVVLSGVDGTLHLPDAVALGEAAQRKAALSSEARGRR